MRRVREDEKVGPCVRSRNGSHGRKGGGGGEDDARRTRSTPDLGGKGSVNGMFLSRRSWW